MTASETVKNRLFNEVSYNSQEETLDISGIPMTLLKEMYPGIYCKPVNVVQAVTHQIRRLLNLMMREAEHLAWGKKKQDFYAQNLFWSLPHKFFSPPALSIMRDWNVETFRAENDSAQEWGRETDKFLAELHEKLSDEDKQNTDVDEYSGYGSSLEDHEFFQGMLHPAVDWSNDVTAGMYDLWFETIYLFLWSKAIPEEGTYTTTKGEKVSYVDMWIRLLEPYTRMVSRTHAVQELNLSLQSGPYPYDADQSRYEKLLERGE